MKGPDEETFGAIWVRTWDAILWATHSRGFLDQVPTLVEVSDTIATFGLWDQFGPQQNDPTSLMCRLASCIMAFACRTRWVRTKA